MCWMYIPKPIHFNTVLWKNSFLTLQMEDLRIYDPEVFLLLKNLFLILNEMRSVRKY